MALRPTQHTDEAGNIFLKFFAGSNKEVVLDHEDQRFIYRDLAVEGRNQYATLADLRNICARKGRSLGGLSSTSLKEVVAHINRRCKEDISDHELEHWAYVGSGIAEARLRGRDPRERQMRRPDTAAGGSLPSGSRASLPANRLGQSGPGSGSQADAEAQNRRAHPSTRPRSSHHSQSPDSPASRAAADALIQINHEDTALGALTGLPRGDNRNYRR